MSKIDFVSALDHLVKTGRKHGGAPGIHTANHEACNRRMAQGFRFMAIASDALGADRVRAVMMPFRYTSTMSQEDAAHQAATLGVRYDVLPIDKIVDATLTTLAGLFAAVMVGAVLSTFNSVLNSAATLCSEITRQNAPASGVPTGLPS